MPDTITDLRATVAEWTAGRCEWPGCRQYAAELAHVHGKGMGGRPSADTLDNLAFLCVYHHNLLDGRAHHGLRFEMGNLLAAYLQGGWRATIERES